jgi:hypothetical protein
MVLKVDEDTQHPVYASFSDGKCCDFTKFYEIFIFVRLWLFSDTREW